MSDTQPTTTALAATVEPARLRVRINVEKNSKGHNYETTVEVEWVNRSDATMDYLVVSPILDDDGAERVIALHAVLRDLLRVADSEARAEIARRESADVVSS